MSINQALGENYDDEILKERYVFVYDLPNLQEIASYEVCRTIWYSNLSKFQLIEAEDIHVIHCRIMIGFSLFGHYQKHNQQLIKHLNVPALIEGILENSMNKVCAEIESWVTEFYYRTINLEDHCGIRFIDPKWWVWSVNGKIDYSKSARKVLQDVSLTEWQKFLVMCRYCMADEISKFSLDTLPPQFFTENYHYRNFICFYWICFLKNELHRIPVINDYSADWTIAKHYVEAEYRMVENVFWDRLNDDQQITLVSYWINMFAGRSKKGNIISEHFISKMSLSQQQCLLRKTSHTILTFFASYSDSSRCALWAWRYAGNQMPVKQFAKLVKALLKKGRTWKPTSLLGEIWNTASAHQRNHVIRTKLDKFVDLLLIDSGSTFSDRFLQLISDEERKKMIFRLPNREIFKKCDLDFLSRFLNECLPCPDDQSTFGKLVIDSRSFIVRLVSLLSNKEYESFNKVWECCFFHDAAAAQIFKREFLEQKLTTTDVTFDIGLLTSIDKWNELSRFIDEVFDNDPKRGLTVKQWFITSAFTKNIRRWNVSLSDKSNSLSQCFDVFVKIVEMVFKNDDLENVKRLLSNHVCSLATDSERHVLFMDIIRPEIFFLKFMQWCSVHNGKPILKL